MNHYQLPIVRDLFNALKRNLPVLQIITGPRQVGKSTAARQIAALWEGPVIHVSADSPVPPGPEWIRHHWYTMRKYYESSDSPLLILDEIQKVFGWSEEVKAQWDNDHRSGRNPSVLLLGSSALLIQQGLSESLTGRFQLHRMTHWQWRYTADAFGLSLDEWLYFGGYPGALLFRDDEKQWKGYVRDSLIETVLSRDVLQIHSISKPALLRNLFLLSASYPAQILSFNKMLGQLVNAGNTTTLSHYVQILEGAFLLTGLEQYKIGERPKRGSSPKLILWNNALITALSVKPYRTFTQDTELWGRIVENAVGAALLNGLAGFPHEVFYWRKGNDEVDFVVHTPEKIWAVEVKSSRPGSTRGLRLFLDLHPKAQPLIIGGNGMPLEEFFRSDPVELFQ